MSQELEYLKEAHRIFFEEYASKNTGPYDSNKLKAIRELIIKSVEAGIVGETQDPDMSRFIQWRDTYIRYNNNYLGFKDYDNLCRITSAIKHNTNTFFNHLIDGYKPNEVAKKELQKFINQK